MKTWLAFTNHIVNLNQCEAAKEQGCMMEKTHKFRILGNFVYHMYSAVALKHDIFAWSVYFELYSIDVIAVDDGNTQARKNKRLAPF